jgi:Mlc titration factor MtfA (ptsG expression regulator)
MPVLLILFLILSVVGWVVFRQVSRRSTHRSMLATPLTANQRGIVADEVPLVRQLPPEMAKKLEGKINAFLHQVTFVGCDGLEVTERMRLSIAAQACLLIVNSDAWYRNLRTILLYPGAFRSLRKEHEGYVVTERKTVRLGESWARGPVVLSWAHSAQGARDERDGHNLVLHEFAHQLDDLSGHTDGAPAMARGQSFADYERVIVDAYERHVREVETGRKTVIDEYGATSHQEFFAVAVETFFEKPLELKQDEPEVYAQLSMLLRLDPASWV